MTPVNRPGFGEAAVEMDSYNQGVDMEAVAANLVKLTRRMPPMADSYFRGGWSGLFTITPDWHPILDRVPGIDGLYCAVGFSGHGFKLAPIVGKMMADLITRGKSDNDDINFFAFDRFAREELVEGGYAHKLLG